MLLGTVADTTAADTFAIHCLRFSGCLFLIGTSSRLHQKTRKTFLEMVSRPRYRAQARIFSAADELKRGRDRLVPAESGFSKAQPFCASTTSQPSACFQNYQSKALRCARMCP